MEINSEILKLSGILLGGALFLLIGFLLQKKTKKKEEEAEFFNSNSNEAEMLENPIIRQYIETYKSSYPREALYNALIEAGHSKEDIENHLKKFY